jgi:hypothetical protein
MARWRCCSPYPGARLKGLREPGTARRRGRWRGRSASGDRRAVSTVARLLKRVQGLLCIGQVSGVETAGVLTTGSTISLSTRIYEQNAGELFCIPNNSSRLTSVLSRQFSIAGAEHQCPLDLFALLLADRREGLLDAGPNEYVIRQTGI